LKGGKKKPGGVEKKAERKGCDGSGKSAMGKTGPGAGGIKVFTRRGCDLHGKPWENWLERGKGLPTEPVKKRVMQSWGRHEAKEGGETYGIRKGQQERKKRQGEKGERVNGGKTGERNGKRIRGAGDCEPPLQGGFSNALGRIRSWKKSPGKRELKENTKEGKGQGSEGGKVQGTGERVKKKEKDGGGRKNPEVGTRW